MTIDETTKLLTELAKLITPSALIVSILLQLWRERRAKKRGEAAQESAAQAQGAARRAETQVAHVAQTLAETDTATKEKLSGIAAQTGMVHTLVNSNMGLQLRISSAALRRIAELTGEESDRRVAEEAERLAREHEAKQLKVDRNGEEGRADQ